MYIAGLRTPSKSKLSGEFNIVTDCDKGMPYFSVLLYWHLIGKEMECHRWNEICCKSSLLLRKLHILGHFSAAVVEFATTILCYISTKTPPSPSEKRARGLWVFDLELGGKFANCKWSLRIGSEVWELGVEFENWEWSLRIGSGVWELGVKFSNL